MCRLPRIDREADAGCTVAIGREGMLMNTDMADEAPSNVILRNCRVVVGADVVDRAWLQIVGGRIAEIGTGEPPLPGTDLGGAHVLPGFVDQHCHGGGGGDFGSLTPGVAELGAATHLRHGTTTLVASLVTATTAELLAQIEVLAPLVDDGTFAGIHLEGPWLSRHQCGAHDSTLLRSPDPDEVATLIDAGGGRVVMVTIAPELPGAIDAIRFLTDHGVVSAVGHTNGDADITRAAIDSGAHVATHLFNRMPPMDKRAPGPVLALLADPRVVVEFIADGVHIAPELISFVTESIGADRVAVVTDAMGAAGAPSGNYHIGGLKVLVADGVARLASSGALAGSTLTMDRALTVLMAAGCSLPTASQMLSGTPARAMGWADRGRLAPGLRADLVVLDAHWQVARVMRGGSWVG